MNLFIAFYYKIQTEKFATTPLIIHLPNLFKNKLVWLIQTTWFQMRAAVFEKLWDMSTDLKHTDIKIK